MILWSDTVVDGTTPMYCFANSIFRRYHLSCGSLGWFSDIHREVPCRVSCESSTGIASFRRAHGILCGPLCTRAGLCVPLGGVVMSQEGHYKQAEIGQEDWAREVNGVIFSEIYDCNPLGCSFWFQWDILHVPIRRTNQRAKRSLLVER